MPSDQNVVAASVDADLIIDAIKAEAVKYFAAKVLAEVVKWGSFFSIGFVQTVAAFIIETVLKIAIEKTELGIYVVYADERASAQARKYERAKHEQSKLPDNASDEEKAAARQRVIDAARDLIRWTR